MSTVAGIDIGSESIKGVVLSRSGHGPIQMVAAGTLPIGDLSHLEDSTDKTLAIGEKLKQLVKSARLRGDKRKIGASGSNTSIRYLQVPPVPPWRLDMLIKYEVDEKSGEKEAQTYDYRILDVPEVSGQYTVLIGAMKESAANDLLTMGKAAGLGEVDIDLEALALFSAYYHGHGFDADKTVLVVDIGADDITILLVKSGSLYLARTIMGGGRRFTQVISEALMVDPAEAEEIKKTHAQILFDVIAQPTPGRTGRMIRPGLTGIMQRPGASTTRPGAPITINPGASAATAAPAPAPAAPAAPEPETFPLGNDGDMPLSLEALDASLPGTPAAPAPVPAPPAAQAPAPTTTPAASTPVSTSPATLPLPSAPAPAPVAPAVAPASSISQEPTIMVGATAALMNMSLPAPAMEMNEDKRKRAISAALVKEAASLCAALENAVMICRQQNKLRELKIDRVYVTGGGAQVKGLSEFMNRRLRLEVMPLEPLKQISLDRLPAEQAAALKAEQNNLAVALGLALSEMEKGAISFLLWPETVKQRKVFWSRGAYLGYAAALVALSMSLLIYTPYRNTQALAENNTRAKKAVEYAQAEQRSLSALIESNREKFQQQKQIDDNVNSGRYFLNLLAELKDESRIAPDIYLTSISTNMPTVMRKESDPTTGAPMAPDTGKKREDLQKAAKENLEPNTFQAQRRIYIRGFARSGDKVKLLDKVEAFKNMLVPHFENPDDPRNLFKDIRTVWFNPEDQHMGPYSLKEFVLEAYTEGTKAEATPAAPGGKPVAAGDKTVPAVTVKGAPEAPKAKFVVPSEETK